MRSLTSCPPPGKQYSLFDVAVPKNTSAHLCPFDSIVNGNLGCQVGKNSATSKIEKIVPTAEVGTVELDMVICRFACDYDDDPRLFASSLIYIPYLV